ncbi:hypothetical protein HT031_004132 [Scenedesmus sp. PABB004]|nr:hypothetical protein HT031_004132 [Scenedesmus sp. PABB004]
MRAAAPARAAAVRSRPGPRPAAPAAAAARGRAVHARVRVAGERSVRSAGAGAAPRRPTPPRAARAQAAAAAPPEAAELAAAAASLAALCTAKADAAAIEAAADALAAAAERAGANRVVPELNDGTFRGFTLSGQTAQRFSTVITLGTLSFNLYAPKDLPVKTLGTDSGSVFKGPRDGAARAYVITTPFQVMSAPAGGPDGGAPAPTGVAGRSLAVGEYEQDPDNPQRLGIRFKKMRLEPAEGTDLARWLETFGAANPGMDPASGVLEVLLPEKSPVGWMDYLLMVEGWQLVRGNFGSTTLLQRA